MAKVVKWTKSSIACYKRGCVCEGCEIKRIMQSKCKMKKSVIALVTAFGAPKEKELIDD